jgi:hypothetical protein
MECETVWDTDFPIRLEKQRCPECGHDRFNQDVIGVDIGTVWVIDE